MDLYCFVWVIVVVVLIVLLLKDIVLTEVWHIAHFWVSYDRCAMPGSPMGWSEGLSR